MQSKASFAQEGNKKGKSRPFSSVQRPTYDFQRSQKGNLQLSESGQSTWKLKFSSALPPKYEQEASEMMKKLALEGQSNKDTLEGISSIKRPSTTKHQQWVQIQQREMSLKESLETEKYLTNVKYKTTLKSTDQKPLNKLSENNLPNDPKAKLGIASNFRTTFVPPENKLQKYITILRSTSSNLVSQNTLGKSKKESQEQLTSIKSPNQLSSSSKKFEFKMNEFRKIQEDLESESESENFESIQFGIDEFQYMEQQHDLRNLKFLEEKYRPRKYNQELKPQIPMLKFNNNEVPLDIAALQKNRKALIDRLTTQKGSIQLNEEIQKKIRQQNYVELKEQFFQQESKNRLQQQKKALISRKSTDQTAFELRFLGKKSRQKLHRRLRWYIQKNINMDYEKNNSDAKELQMDLHEQIDNYMKQQLGTL